MAGSPIPATGVAWDTTIPDNGQPQGMDYNEHRETKLAVAARVGKEHVAFDAASVGGEHKAGSAKIFAGDYSSAAAGDALPTKRPDGTTDLDADDAGRLALDTDATYGGIIYRWTGSAWEAIEYVALKGDQTIAGVKTFSSNPVVSKNTCGYIWHETATDQYYRLVADSTTNQIVLERSTSGGVAFTTVERLVAFTSSGISSTYITKYDSGWFAITKNTLYTKAHGLGATPSIILGYIAQNSDGTGNRASLNGSNDQGFDGTGDATYSSRGSGICFVDATNIKIRTGKNSVCCVRDAAGTLWVPASAYARIIVMK